MSWDCTVLDSIRAYGKEKNARGLENFWFYYISDSEKTGEVWAAYVTALGEIGDMERAEPEFNRIPCSDECTDLKNRLIWAYGSNGQAKKAEEIFRKMVDSDPGEKAFYCFGDTFLRDRDSYSIMYQIYLKADMSDEGKKLKKAAPKHLKPSNISFLENNS